MDPAVLKTVCLCDFKARDQSGCFVERIGQDQIPRYNRQGDKVDV